LRLGKELERLRVKGARRGLGWWLERRLGSAYTLLQTLDAGAPAPPVRAGQRHAAVPAVRLPHHHGPPGAAWAVRTSGAAVCVCVCVRACASGGRWAPRAHAHDARTLNLNLQVLAVLLGDMKRLAWMVFKCGGMLNVGPPGGTVKGRGAWELGTGCTGQSRVGGHAGHPPSTPKPYNEAPQPFSPTPVLRACRTRGWPCPTPLIYTPQSSNHAPYPHMHRTRGWPCPTSPSTSRASGRRRAAAAWWVCGRCEQSGMWSMGCEGSSADGTA
jgi:hypothetical protein